MTESAQSAHDSILRPAILCQVDRAEFGEFGTPLPIYLSDVKARHDKMVELVERMLDLHKQLPQAKTPHEQESPLRTVDAADPCARR